MESKQEHRDKSQDADGSPNDRKESQDDSKDPEILQTDEADKRSVFVKNVDYSSTKEEVIDHFKSCGKINRVTIITDKYTRNPKGCCYIEFAEAESVENAKELSDSIFKGRTIQVLPKRTNLPQRSRKMPSRGGSHFGGGRGGFFPRRGGGIGAPFIRGGRRGFTPY